MMDGRQGTADQRDDLLDDLRFPSRRPQPNVKSQQAGNIIICIGWHSLYAELRLPDTLTLPERQHKETRSAFTSPHTCGYHVVQSTL